MALPVFCKPIVAPSSLVMLLMLCVSYSITTLAQGSNDIIKGNDVIAARLKLFMSETSPQKVFVHTNKSTYQCGEIVFLKSYLVNAVDNKPVIPGENVFVELIDADSRIVITLMLDCRSGPSCASFIIPDSLPEGLYNLRAYTNWMRNFNKEFFYSKRLVILNKDKQFYSMRKDYKSKKKMHEAAMYFFPEGGCLLEGASSLLAFKAVDDVGKGISIKGNIFDKKDRLISEVHTLHAGIGSVVFTPDQGMKYYVRFTYKDKSYKIDLPRPEKKGSILTGVFLPGGIFRLNLRSGGMHQGERQKFFLIGHCRGNILYSEIIYSGSGPYGINFLQRDFPAGIVHFTLFSGDGNPLSERLVFMNRSDIVKGNISVILTGNREQDSISIDFPGIKVKDWMSASLSVTSPAVNPLGFGFSGDCNIHSWLLLASGLEGNIEDPDYYFEKEKGRRKALDDLLLTHGWIRYNWDDILKNDKFDIEFLHQDGINVSGRISRDMVDIPIPGTIIILTVLDEYYDQYLDTTDTDGRFRFSLRDYTDTINLMIEAIKPGGKLNTVILIDEVSAPLSDDRGKTEQLSMSYNWEVENFIREHKRGSTYYPKDIDTDGRFRLHRQANNIVVFNDSRHANLRSPLEALTNVPGVQVFGAGSSTYVTLRGTNTMIQSQEPLYVLDGQVVDRYTINSLYPGDVEKIEVVKGANASIYGMQGGNGVVAVYTKRGNKLIKGRIFLSLLAYSDCRAGFNDVVPDTIDTRNPFPVYWLPFLKAGDGSITIPTKNIPVPGELLLDMQGIYRDGKTISVRKKLNY